MRLEPARRVPAAQPQPDYKPPFVGAPKMLITNEGQEETHQQIESVINMFPQPTAEQMEEFNELQ